MHKSWKPHPVQVQIGKALFYQNYRSIFINAGRKFGKSETLCYILWRWAITHPGAQCYYIAPFLNQAKEIVWADPRLITFGPRDWILEGSHGINHTDMRLRFKNGSFIKVDGSDNFERHRGTRPHILCYDEFKDHRKEFREVMRPNLAVYNAPEIFVGTPPEDTGNEEGNEFLVTMKEHQNDPTKLYIHAPTSSNPYISQKWLDEEKARLFARSESDVWFREYEATYVKGGNKKIFPMLNQSHLVPHIELMKSLERDMKKLQPILVADPGVATVFAVLFCLYNPYTKTLYCLDEVYATEQKDTATRAIGSLIDRKKLEIQPRTEWRQVYDEAATWFANEMLDHFEEYFEPTTKSRIDKESGLSLIKDMLLEKKLVISSRCQKLYWELDSYRKEDNGKIKKERDHLIDCLRYALSALNYSLIQTEEEKFEKSEDFRGARIEDDFPELFKSEDDWGDDSW